MVNEVSADHPATRCRHRHRRRRQESTCHRARTRPHVADESDGEAAASRVTTTAKLCIPAMTMSNRSTTLVELLDAIVAGEATAVRLVRATPEIAQARVVNERLVEEVPHQLYVGDTALHLAAAALRPLAVRALIEAGADANAENRRGSTALHYACDARPKAGKTWNPSKQRSVIELLIDAGSDIEHKDKAGAAPLHRAVRARSPQAVRCLLERGARVDAAHGRQRTTPLHIVTHSTGATGTKGACAERQEIVELLLEYGADPRAKDANGNPPRLEFRS